MNKVKLPIDGGLVHLPLIGSFVFTAQRQRGLPMKKLIL
ncbi:hypothetical protein BB14905_15060 [Bacillus sp. B14905]|nr:hypothetical protein BB14905_15060 [Bacillus sp. B14905]